MAMVAADAEMLYTDPCTAVFAIEEGDVGSKIGESYHGHSLWNVHDKIGACTSSTCIKTISRCLEG